MQFTPETSVSNKRHWRLGRRIGLATALAALFTLRTMATADDQPSAPETDTTTVSTPEGFEKIVLEPGSAQKVSFGKKIKRANILIPDVADVIPLGPDDLLVTAKKSGMTQLIIWDDADNTTIINVVVASDIEKLRKQIKELFPAADITIDETGGALTMHGHVPTLQDADAATQIAANYGRVLNLLEISGSEQIMLQVRIAEVSKQAEQQLGFNFGGTDGTSVWGGNIGANSLGAVAAVPPTFSGSATAGATGTSATATESGGSPASLLIPAGALATAQTFGLGTFGNVAFAYFVNALESNNIIRLLAEPNLVTTSGEEAHFLAGGQFPYPVPQSGSGGGTTITIQYQSYGVDLKFVPIVLGNGKIRLKVHPTVSELDFAHSVSVAGTSVPGLTQREVETTVEMGEGQTLALAGLLQDNISGANAELPILGDLPIIGPLFRSVQYQRNETELVIMVTPVLVHPMDPAEVTEVPGGKWRNPTPTELFLFKDLGGEDVSSLPKDTPNTTASAQAIPPIETPETRQQAAATPTPTLTPTPTPTATPTISSAPIRPVASVTPAAPKAPSAPAAPVAPATPAAPTVPASPSTPTAQAVSPSTPTAPTPAAASTVQKPVPVPAAQPTSPPPLFQGTYGFSPANSNSQQTAGASDSLK